MQVKTGNIYRERETDRVGGNIGYVFFVMTIKTPDHSPISVCALNRNVCGTMYEPYKHKLNYNIKAVKCISSQAMS